MRKISVFGKTVSVYLVMALAMAGIGSAALVGYLSNTTEANIVVDSPFEIKILDGAHQSTSASSVQGIT